MYTILHPILDYPFRSPLYIVDYLKDIVKDRTLCDVGCACGDLAIEFAKICKKVYGIEHDVYRASVTKARGIEVCQEIPDCDVYYVWANADGLIDIMNRLKSKHGTLILAEESRDKSLGGYEMEIPLREYDENRTFWHLQIVEI